MPKVLVFKETLLQPSETFILAQVGAMQEYVPTLAGLERAHPRLPLPQEPLLLSDRRPAVSDFRAKIYRRNGIAPLFHRKAKRARPDLIHAHFASGGRAALPLARALGIPLVVTFHGADVTVKGKHRETYKALAEEASLFLCVSEFIRARALEAGFPAQKLRVHLIGIDRKLFSPCLSNQPPEGILFVGRLVEKKGCEYLLRAMQRVQRAHPRCALTIIGDGPLRPSLEALANDLNVSCHFLGVQPAATVRASLLAARLVCVPSVTAANGDSEGLPTVVGEALAMGIPVVGTTHAGIPELVIPQVTGLLSPERDPDALADALCMLLADEDLWQRMHRCAPEQIAQRFDLHTQTALLEQIYTGILVAK